MALTFTAPDEATANLLRLVASSSGVEISASVAGSDVEFLADGSKAFGLHTACRAIAAKSAAAAQLLGGTPEQQAKVAEWVSFQHTSLSPLMDSSLAELDAALAGRTYLAGGRQPTLADLVLYAAVSPAAVAFPVAQHGHFCNLLRWYDLLNHTADAQGLFPAASFVRPKYVAPPPPPPAEPKAAKGGDKAAAADKGGKGGDKAAAAAVPAASASSGALKKAGKVAAAAAADTAATPAAPPAAPPAAGGKKEKGAKKEKGGAAPATPAVSGEAAAAGGKGSGVADECTVDMLDIRVGQIVKVDRHPNADSLYLEEIDLGEGQPRQVVSGLVKFVPADQMQGRRVVVVCNLKPAKMREVMSYGMVLCASNDTHDQVDPILPPEGAAIGDRITFEGYGKEPEAQLNPKKKQFEKIAPDLRVDANGVCVYRGVPMMTSKGAVTATISNAWVK